MDKKRRRDGKATRARLLEAAGNLIAQQGFAHTTNKTIAEKAGVDLATINYHFGGRDGLYEAVMAEGHRHFIDIARLEALDESNMTPKEKLACILEQFMTTMMEDPGWQAKIVVRELVAPPENAKSAFESVIMPNTLYLQKIIHQITGIPENDFSIQRCLMNIMGPCLMLLVLRSGVETPVQQMLKTDSSQALINHHLNFTLAGLDAVTNEYFKKKQGKDQAQSGK